MKLPLILALLPLFSFAQSKTPEGLGFRHVQYTYQSDVVDILIKSKENEEYVKKPIFFFCEGSLPRPLIITDGEKVYDKGINIFPFKVPDELLTNFHLVMVSKPFIPLIRDKSELGRDFMYVTEAGKVPDEYQKRNYLDYYVKRNIEVIDYLQTLTFVDDSKLVMSGHSQGSTVAAQLAYEYDKVTHLIFSGGNPFGRIMNIIGQYRKYETDSLPKAERAFTWWEGVVNNPDDLEGDGDTDKNTFDFSKNMMDELMALEIQVLVTFGTLDYNAPFNDYLRVEAIRQKKSNFTFKAYIGTEHNYFYLNPDGSKNHDIFNWDDVAVKWTSWLLQ